MASILEDILSEMIGEGPAATLPASARKTGRPKPKKKGRVNKSKKNPEIPDEMKKWLTKQALMQQMGIDPATVDPGTQRMMAMRGM